MSSTTTTKILAGVAVLYLFREQLFGQPARAQVQPVTTGPVIQRSPTNVWDAALGIVQQIGAAVTEGIRTPSVRTPGETGQTARV